MKRVLIIVIGATFAAATADATDFVNEDFEGTLFPPSGWTTKGEGTASGSWTERGGGPWGRFADGQVVSYEQGYVRITLMSYEFDLKANTKVYYGFDYRFQYGGNYTDVGADFYIAYVPSPGGNLVYCRLPGSGWTYFSGYVVNTHEARVKAHWRIWVSNSFRYAGGALWLDNVVISDEDPSAVAPASLGRVKALFK